MTTTIRLVGAFIMALSLAFALPSEDVFAQNDRGSLRGKPGGGPGPGGTVEDIPLIIVFRDADTDRLTSDGGAYIAGGTDIDRAAFGGSRQIVLSFIQPKRKQPPPSRYLTVDLSAGPVECWAGEGVCGPLSQTFKHNGWFHIPDNSPDRQIPDLEYLDSLEANFPLFSERRTAPELVGWRVSYSDDRLASEGIVDTVTVTCVDPAAVGGQPCIAWKVEKLNDLPLQHAALVNGGTKEEPDAGAWSLPFAIAVCLRDAPPAWQGPWPFTANPGDTCKSYVF